MPMTSIELARKAGQLAFSKKGFDVKILKVEEISSICDYFVIVSGEADVQVKAIANSIEDGLFEEGVKPFHKEGTKEGHWILLDYVDVVVHVFNEPTRQFYALEKLWGDAHVEQLVDE
ncbi:MAG: ribosome silencing factor [Candidatus Zixiibacteriota bacterium]|nr:MAG: ribosome silencing factor [candidate division Zixibacteria bacterium]